MNDCFLYTLSAKRVLGGEFRYANLAVGNHGGNGRRGIIGMAGGNMEVWSQHFILRGFRPIPEYRREQSRLGCR